LRIQVIIPQSQKRYQGYIATLSIADAPIAIPMPMDTIALIAMTLIMAAQNVMKLQASSF
jgi:hypothetical protein